MSLCFVNRAYANEFVPNVENVEEEQISIPITEERSRYEIDGNTGDLPLEEGAVLWPEMTLDELRDYQEKQREVKELVRDPAYQRALEESERVEEMLRRGETLPEASLKVHGPFSSSVQPYGATEIYQRYCDVPLRKQETDYYCGPATVKQLDDYFNGNRYTQRQIAGYLGTTAQGTDFSRVKQFLRDYVKSGYVLIDIGNFDNWHGIVVKSINNNMPAVLDINAQNVKEIEYRSTGHILNVSGYRFGSVPNMVRVTDPHWRYAGIKDYPAHALYQANKNHSRQEMIY